MLYEKDSAVAAIYNYVEEKNTNQIISERLKAANNQQKQEISRLTEELKLTKSIVADLRVEANIIYSDNNIAVSKLQKLQEVINEITKELNITRVRKEEAKEKIHKLKSVIS